MPEFKASFCDEYVRVGGGAYKCGETLAACLNLPGGELNDCLVRLWRLAPSARLNVVGAEQLRAFLGCLQQTQEVLARLDALAASVPLLRESGLLPPAERLLTGPLDRLCADGGAANVEIDDLFYFSGFYFMRVASHLARMSGGEAARELDRLNSGVAGVFDRCISLAGDILQAQRVYPALLDGYIHQKGAFLSDEELAGCLARYRSEGAGRDGGEPLPDFVRVKCSYEPFTDREGRARLALVCGFERLREFLYVDFFRGLERAHLPRRCDNCGRWFLLAGGKYSRFCDLPLPGGAGRTCRAGGAGRRFGSKCRSDPVWLAYNRAYKARYARRMRGTMSAEDFERWRGRAVELRGRAVSGEIGLEEFELLLRE